MKKIILSMALVVLTTLGASAQDATGKVTATETVTQNTKGDWYVGTSDFTNTAWTDISIQPTIGYAFADNYMIGMTLAQADSTADLSLGLMGRYFYKGFFGFVALDSFEFDEAQLGVGRMFTFHRGSMFVDPKIVYDLGMETTNLQIGFGLKF